MEKIKLNFVPLINQENNFLVYRKYVEDSSVRQGIGLYRTKLPDRDENTDWGLYDIYLANCLHMLRIT